MSEFNAQQVVLVEVMEQGPATAVIDADIAQHVILVEVEVSQGPPGAQGPAGPNLPAPGVPDLGKVGMVRDKGAGPVWAADFLVFPDIGGTLQANRIAGAFTVPQVINTSGGVAPPVIDAATVLQLVGQPARNARVEADGFGGGGAFVGRRANGTPAAPTAVKNLDGLVVLNGAGYGATGYTGGQGNVTIQAAEDWSDTAHGTAVVVGTTLNGTAIATTRWQVTHDGHILPWAGSVYDLGSAAARVRAGYFDTITANTINAPGGYTPPLIVNGTGGAVTPSTTPANDLVQVFGPAGGAVRTILNGYGGNPAFLGKRARGTPTAPTAVKALDLLANFGGRGYGATGYSVGGGGMNVSAEEDWTDTAQGAKLIFTTTPVGSSNQLDRWALTGDGHWLPTLSNTYDIGALATGGPRVIYAGGRFNVDMSNLAQRPLTPGALFYGAGATGYQVFTQLDTFQNAPALVGRAAMGTPAAPAATVAGLALIQVDGRGYGATGYTTTRGLVDIAAAETWTDAAQGASVRFATTPIGGAALAYRWQFSDAGHLLPFTTNAYDLGAPAAQLRSGYFTAQLHVNQAGVQGPAVLDGNTLIQATSLFSSRVELNAFGQGFGSVDVRAARGTPAAPTATQVGDWMAQWGAKGYGATGFAAATNASIVFNAAENFTNAAQGTNIVIGTTPVGSNALQYRWQFSASGQLMPFGGAQVDFGAPAFPVHSGYFGSAVVIDQTAGAIPPPLVGGAQLRMASTAGNWTTVDLVNYAGVAAISGRRANGTAAAPAALTVSNVLLLLEGRGYDANGWTAPAAQITYATTEAWTTATHGSNILFATTPKGTVAPVNSWQVSDFGAFAPLQDKAFDIGMSGVARVRTVYADNININGQADFGHTGGANDSGFIRLNNKTGNDYLMADAATRDLTWNVGGVPIWVIRQSGKMEVIGPATINGDLVATGAGWFGDTGQLLLRSKNADQNSVVGMRQANASYWIYDWTNGNLSWVENNAIKSQVTTAGNGWFAQDVQASRDVTLNRNIAWGTDATKPMLRPATGSSGALIDTVTADQSRFADFRARAFVNVASTVASLPASPLGASRAFVTDATANTFGAAVVGGGPYAVPVYFDGGSWKVG